MERKPRSRRMTSHALALGASVSHPVHAGSTTDLRGMALRRPVSRVADLHACGACCAGDVITLHCSLCTRHRLTALLDANARHASPLLAASRRPTESLHLSDRLAVACGVPDGLLAQIRNGVPTNDISSNSLPTGTSRLPRSTGSAAGLDMFFGNSGLVYRVSVLPTEPDQERNAIEGSGLRATFFERTQWSVSSRGQVARMVPQPRNWAPAGNAPSHDASAEHQPRALGGN